MTALVAEATAPRPDVENNTTSSDAPVDLLEWFKDHPDAIGFSYGGGGAPDAWFWRGERGENRVAESLKEALERAYALWESRT